MKHLLLTLMFSLAIGNDLSIEIITNGKSNIEMRNIEDKIYVLLKNESSDSISIWNPNSERGYSQLWFETKIGMNKIDTIRPRSWPFQCCNSKSGNKKYILNKNESVIFEINLLPGKGGWENSPYSRASQSAPILLKVHYMSSIDSLTDSAWKYRNNHEYWKTLWKGAIESEWKEFNLKGKFNTPDDCKSQKPYFGCLVNYPDGFYPEKSKSIIHDMNMEMKFRNEAFDKFPDEITHDVFSYSIWVNYTPPNLKLLINEMNKCKRDRDCIRTMGIEQ